ncbi:MAG: MFS transporter [Ilumatobacter sp.]|nr:MFS transporter [Ilumatobacter sp.]
MKPGGRIVTRTWPSDDEHRSMVMAPRDDLLREVRTPDAPADDDADGATFDLAHGPFSSYERVVDITAGEIVERTTYRLTIPWFGWLFAVPVRQVIARRLSARGWWTPPDQLDATQVLVIGLLAAASMSAAFINTLFTQTVNFAADDFGVGDAGIGDAGAIVRAGIIIALPAAIMADRVGRRRIITVVAWLAPVLSLLGALAPNFTVLVATQTVARPMGIALAFLIGVVAAEEMPKSSRAYAISVLAMASGFGAGVAVMSLGLADVGPWGWRLVYVVSLIWCVVALDLTRRLPETRRFAASAAADAADRGDHDDRDDRDAVVHAAGPETAGAPADPERSGHEPDHPDPAAAGWPTTIALRTRVPRLDRRRITLLAAVAFIGNVFIAPASFFQNNYLTDVRGFSGLAIGVFSIVVGTPAGIGLIIGGRIADTRGRKPLIGVVLPASALAVVLAFSFGPPLLWAFAFFAATLGSMAYPAMAVYRAELFPTGNRSRAAGLITASALLGGIVGLVSTGRLIDAGWSYGAVMLLLLSAQLIVTLIVLTSYPETAHTELEDLNPEDAPLTIM